MLITDFLLSRKSVRSFRAKDLSAEEVQAINEGLNEINSKNNGTLFQLHTNGDEIFEALDGHGGYGGVMIEAPAYISMNIIEERAESYIMAAYSMEHITTILHDLGFGSCWVTLSSASDDVLKKTFNNEEGLIKYIIAFGKAKRSFNFGSTDFVPKIGIEDYVFKSIDEKEPYTIEELEVLGLADLFYYLRMAPSSKDKQPWRFVIDGGEISLYIQETDQLDDFVDVGIVLYYFDNLAKASNLNIDWQIDVKPIIEKQLVYIGKTKF